MHLHVRLGQVSPRVCAHALLGDAVVGVCAEPSTGMDPMAWRFMWDVISRVSTQDAKCSVVLTTHSMEEAEALCTRIGISKYQCINLGGRSRGPRTMRTADI